jgi:hypothetical protein
MYTVMSVQFLCSAHCLSQTFPRVRHNVSRQPYGTKYARYNIYNGRIALHVEQHLQYGDLGFHLALKIT